MADQDESGFTFVDKRGAQPDPEQSPTSKTSGLELNEQSSAQDAERLEPADPDDPAGHGAVPRLNVRDRLLMCIDILNQGAWISLGLISDPATGQIEADLPAAKAAIDSVAFLAERVDSSLDEETRRELRSLVRDLQLNFVQQSGR